MANDNKSRGGVVGRIMSLFGRRSIENPAVPLSDPNHWLGEFGGTSSSGVHVSASKALTYSPLWRAINIIASDVGRVDLIVYAREGDGGHKLATDHPAYRLLRYKSNPYMSAFTCKQTIQWRAVLHGNGYGAIVRSGSGRPTEVLPLANDTVMPVRVDGQMWYIVRAGNEQVKIPGYDMIHVRGMGDGLEGMSLVDKARDALGFGLAAKQYGSSYFKNGAKPPIILEHPASLSDKAVKNLRESWERMHQGVGNAHRLAIAEEGMKAHELSINAKDAQLIEAMKFSIIDVSNFTGVPPHKLGDSSRVSYNSLEQENQAYLDQALDPWMSCWEQECWDKLLTEPQKQRDTHFVQFDRRELIRADHTARASYYREATGGHPWMTVNQVRAEEGMNPIPGYDKIKVPTNNFGPAEGGEPVTPDAGEPQDAPTDEAASAPMGLEAHKRLVSDAMRRACTYLANRARKAAKGKTPEQFGDWLDESLEDEGRQAVTQSLTPVLEAVEAVTGLKRSTDDAAAELFAAFRDAMYHAADGPADELAGRVSAMVDDLIETYPPHSARLIVDGRGYAAAA